jgi:hypothetical protein
MFERPKHVCLEVYYQFVNMICNGLKPKVAANLNICDAVFSIYRFCLILKFIFLMVKCGVLYEVRTESLNII